MTSNVGGPHVQKMAAGASTGSYTAHTVYEAGHSQHGFHIQDHGNEAEKGLDD
jgi:hypothetical protein